MPHRPPLPPFHLISIGSNIAPERNVPRILDALLDLHPRMWVSSIGRTAPIGVRHANGDPAGGFYNLAVLIALEATPDRLKAHTNAIERALGRDRDNPNSKRLPRPADLDPLWSVDVIPATPPPLPDEPYVRPFVIELLSALGLPTPPPGPLDRVTLPVREVTLGTSPMALWRQPDGALHSQPLPAPHAP